MKSLKFSDVLDDAVRCEYSLSRVTLGCPDLSVIHNKLKIKGFQSPLLCVAITYIPYAPNAPPQDLDTAELIPADDPRHAGDDPLPEHPQGGLGLLYYAGRRPVTSSIVPMLPTGEIIDTLVLPEPGEVPILQFVLGLTPDLPQSARDNIVARGQILEWDFVLIVISAIVSAMASTVLHSFNFTGADVSAILLSSADATPSINRFVESNEFRAEVASLLGNECSGFFLRLKALIEHVTASLLPDELWDSRAFCNTGRRQPHVVCCLAYRRNFLDSTPCHGNPMSVDAILLCRPAEWGLSAREADADLKDEIKDIMPIFGPGVYSHEGTRAFYILWRAKGCPYIFVVHAAQFVQLIMRACTAVVNGLQNAPPMQEVFAPAVENARDVNLNVRQAYENIPLIGNTGIVPPFAIRKYYHREQLVAAPAFNQPMFFNMVVYLLKGLPPRPPTFVGLPA